MDGTQVGVLKQFRQICLAGLLQGPDGGRLEPQVRPEVRHGLLGNLTNLERRDMVQFDFKNVH